MIPSNKPSDAEQSGLDALLAFDRALASGDNPSLSGGSAALLHPVHECQRLLEAVWPRAVFPGVDLPNHFGRFSIVRELGRGGFGVVFLAEDTVLGRQVALKIPRPEALVSPELRRRFLREAEAASRLDHPHIVPVFEFGQEGAVCFIASAYCEGLTLAQWLALQPVPPPVRPVCRLASMLATAVAHAHARGILHRDLKPSNVLLEERKASDRSAEDLGFVPRICDFGLAKLADDVSADTKSGLPIGSPAYMAPEQASGRIREHGVTTDVYALGVILYEMLAGRPPHRGQSDLETLRQISDLEAPSPRKFRPGLPRDLETIVLKCLAKQAADRYQGAIELVADLERFLSGRPVQARPVRLWVRAAKWAQRRPAHAALSLVVAIGTLAAIGGMVWARQRTDELKVVRERSRQSEIEAREQRALANRERMNSFRHEAAISLKRAGSFVERGEYGAARSTLAKLIPPQGLFDSRGFAWLYLDRLLLPPRELPSLPEKVVAVAASANGKMIALASPVNRRVYVLDRETLAFRILKGEPKLDWFPRLMFSPDGRTLAALTRGRNKQNAPVSEVTLWDIESGGMIEVMPEHLGVCYQIVFSPDGQNLVTVEATLWNRANPVRSWKLSTDRKRIELTHSLRADELSHQLQKSSPAKGPTSRPFELPDILAVSPGDEGTTAVSLETGEVFLYLTRTGYCQAVCRVEGAEAVFVPRTDLFTPYSAAQLDEIARLVRSLTLCTTARSISADVPIVKARFSFDGGVAAVCERYGKEHRASVRMIDVGTGRRFERPANNEIWDVVQFEFTRRADELIVTEFATRAQVWERPVALLAGHTKEVWGVLFSRDGRTLISASDDHTIGLWDAASGRLKGTLKGHGSLVMAVALSPDGEVLASAGWDKTVRLWKLSSGTALATLTGHRDHVRSIAFSPDGSAVASGSDDREIRIWNAATGRELTAPLMGHLGWVTSLAFAKDGNTLYSGAGDKTIKLWDPHAGRLRETWSADASVWALAFSPDAQTLAASHTNGTIRLWDVARAKALITLPGHEGNVCAIAFSPDGLTLASGGADDSVRLWDTFAEQELFTLHGHKADVRGIAFSPDGKILASGSFDGEIKLWRGSSARSEFENN